MNIPTIMKGVGGCNEDGGGGDEGGEAVSNHGSIIKHLFLEEGWDACRSSSAVKAAAATRPVRRSQESVHRKFPAN